MRGIRPFYQTQKREIFLCIIAILFSLLLWSKAANDTLHFAYQNEISPQIHDKNGELLHILPNQKGHYMIATTSSARIRELVVRKEDRFFYYHLGVNPWSTTRSLFHYLFYSEHVGGSTITQQLAKILLGNENTRTFGNKFTELFYAVALELHTPKEELLTMYLNGAYFGSQIEGVAGASQYYFGKQMSELSDGEIVRLLALLSAPSFDPSSAGNTARATIIGKRIGVEVILPYSPPPREIREPKKDPAMFELTGIDPFTGCGAFCALTVDRELTATIREMVRDRLSTKQFESVANAAVVVIKLGKGAEHNRILALVGSPDPYGGSHGSQINMALASRPIGSTWKPFIYGKAIEKGARPYTIIDDTEYRYEIGTGFAFYPKNYDGIYRGDVTLHYALSNSLNVPAVRALEFDGIDEFGLFMKESLGLLPRQPLDTYQLGIALGGLEMNPLLLANYFTIFPREGILAPLDLVLGRPAEIPMSTLVSSPTRVFAATTTALISKMLSDRLMGVEQFGLESNLNLPFTSYAVKTGTTYDYHDSWTVGYTPDVVVVVWIGNSDNKAMDLLSGARGAGKIWHDVMTLLVAEGEIIPQDFDTQVAVSVETPEGNSFGLVDDDIAHARLIMKGQDIILEPHDKDVLRFAPNMSVPLRSEKSVVWRANNKVLGEGEKIFWTPKKAGEYVITASDKDGAQIETLTIDVIE